jgi:maleate isomerase
MMLSTTMTSPTCAAGLPFAAAGGALDVCARSLSELAGRVSGLTRRDLMNWPLHALRGLLPSAPQEQAAWRPTGEIATRLGVLIPPANIVCETEFPQALPPGFGVHFQRLQRPSKEITADSLVGMKDSVQAAAQTLALAPVDVIAYACTSGSFLSGSGEHDQIASDITGYTGKPAVTTSTAVLQALRAVGADQVYVITPYPAEIAAKSVDFVRDNGLAVSGDHTFACATSAAIRAVTVDDIVNQARAAMRQQPQTNAVFVSCTNLPSLEYIAALEGEIGVPVVSSNSATLWSALRTAGFADDLPVLGQLGRHAA